MRGAVSKTTPNPDVVKQVVELYAVSYEDQQRFNLALNISKSEAGLPSDLKKYVRDRLRLAESKGIIGQYAAAAKDFNRRDIHGPIHSVLTSVYSRLFADFYNKHLKAGIKKEDQDLAMILTASHDAAREHGGPDHLEHQNAVYSAIILKANGYSEEEAVRLSLLVANKDGGVTKAERNAGLTSRKDQPSKLIQCSDCAAIMRLSPFNGFEKSGGFNPDYLNAWQDLKRSKGKRLSDDQFEAAKADLEKLLLFINEIEKSCRASGIKSYEGLLQYAKTLADGAKGKDFDDLKRKFNQAVDIISSQTEKAKDDARRVRFTESVLRVDEDKRGASRAAPTHPAAADSSAAKPAVTDPNISKTADVQGVRFHKLKQGNFTQVGEGSGAAKLSQIPVAIAGSTNSGIFWQVGGGGMNGALCTYCDARGITGGVNSYLQKVMPGKNVAEVTGKVSFVDLEKFKNSGDINQWPLKKIIYSASPDLGGNSAKDAEKAMKEFGKKFREELNANGISEVVMPLFSGGFYAGVHSKPDIARWMMEGFFEADKSLKSKAGYNPIEVYCLGSDLFSAVEKMRAGTKASAIPAAETPKVAAKKAEEPAAPNPKVVAPAKDKEKKVEKEGVLPEVAAKAEGELARESRKKEEMQAKKAKKALSDAKESGVRYRGSAAETAEVEEKEGAELELKDSTQKKKVSKATAAAKTVAELVTPNPKDVAPNKSKEKKAEKERALPEVVAKEERESGRVRRKKEAKDKKAPVATEEVVEIEEREEVDSESKESSQKEVTLKDSSTSELARSPEVAKTAQDVAAEPLPEAPIAPPPVEVKKSLEDQFPLLKKEVAEEIVVKIDPKLLKKEEDSDDLSIKVKKGYKEEWVKIKADDTKFKVEGDSVKVNNQEFRRDAMRFYLEKNPASSVAKAQATQLAKMISLINVGSDR